MNSQDYIIECIKLEGNVCLYETSATPVIDQLRDMMTRIRSGAVNIHGVLLIQEGAADDYSKTWLHELEHDLLAETLSERILQMRELCSQIRHSPIPWAFATNDRTLGSHWELALACRERYVFAEHCSLGFPEIKVGAFPPAGLVENIGRKRSRTRDRLQAVPVAEPQYALRHNIVQFAGEATNFSIHAQRLFQRRLANASPRIAAPDAIPVDATVEAKPRHEIFRELTRRLPTFQTGRTQQASAWELCWTLIKNYTPQMTSTINSEIAALASQFFLSVRYRTWLSKRIALRASASNRSPLLRTVTIDLNHLVPPSSILNRLIHLNTNLVFVAAEPKALQTSLDLVYTRLEKDAAWQELARYWKAHVSWYVGDCSENHGSYMRFLLDDRAQIQGDGVKADVFRLGGNDRHARRGACEWPLTHEEPSEMLASATALTANRLVRTRAIGPDQIPVSVWIRSLCFEELVRVSPHFQNDLLAVVDQLGVQGWDFAGRVEAWDRFLRNRSQSYPFREDLARLCEQPLSQPTWEVGLFKHARSIAKRDSGNLRPWNPAELSVHIAIFTGLLALLIESKGWCLDPQDAEVMCMESLGLPDSFGSPLSYLRRRGMRRVTYYVDSHWHGFDCSLIWRNA